MRQSLLVQLLILVTFNICTFKSSSINAASKPQHLSYSINDPNNSWQRIAKNVWVNEREGKSLFDTRYQKCPNRQLIDIFQIRYRPSGYKKLPMANVEWNTLMGRALNYIDGFKLSSNEDKSKRIYESCKPVTINGYEGTEIIFRTNFETYLNCEENELKSSDVMIKIVMLKRGDWSFDTYHDRRLFPHFLMFQYFSPASQFNQGIEDFDKMLESVQITQ